MGCCSEMREYKQSKVDQFTPTELAIGLHHLRIHEFCKVIREENDKSLFSIEDLGNKFKSTVFGQKLLASEDNPTKKLLKNSLFKSGRHLDKYHLLPLGLLYSRGSTQEKVEAIYSMFDISGDRFLYTTSLKRLIRDIYIIAGVLVPSISMGKDIATPDPATLQEIDSMVEHTINALFGSEMVIDQATLELKLMKDQNFLLNPRQLRVEVQSQTQSLNYQA